MADLSTWLAGQGLAAEDLSEPVAGRFWDDLRARGSYLVKGTSPGPLLDYLRGIGVLPQRPGAPASVLLKEYGRHDGGMRVSTEAALAARRRSTEAALGRVRDAIARLCREKAQVSVAAISRRADVSRTFLYGNPDARAAVAAAIAQAGEQRTRILAQRTRIGELLGQVRDLQSEWTQEAIQRITTENATLKQRVRTLTAGNRTLEEKLKAARENLRFHDKRIAGLEAQLAPPE